MVNNEKQRYFQTQEKLKAITRIKAGERHFSVAHSLGITCETLCEWITSLAPVDWQRGVKAVSGTSYDLLDRALYTWFIQQLGMDLRPTNFALKKRAEIFSTRLYGHSDGIVSDQWIEKWQDRHNIKEKRLDGHQLQDGEASLLDDLISGYSKSKKLVLECDFNIGAAIDSILNQDSKKRLLDKTFHDLKEKKEKLCEDFQEVDKIYEDLKNLTVEFRVGLLNTFGKEYGLVRGMPGALNAEKGQGGNSEVSSDVVHIGQKSLQREHLPPFGPIERQKLRADMEVYAVKLDLLGVWVKGVVLEVVSPNSASNPNTFEMYRVRLKVNKVRNIRFISARHMAYVSQPSVTLPVGTRVIAQYKDEVSPQLNALYAGIIAEPPKITNNQRYLIFFDDGYAQYVRHNEVHLVCESNKEVWRDIHKDSQEYIKSYLEKYPERPMVKLQKKQAVKIEWNGSWWSAVVINVDASLVHMYFEADKRTEWIYRGSTRLAPLYNELMSKDESRVTSRIRRSFLKRKHQPYVEYTTGMDEPPEKQTDGFQTARKHTKNTARKSTTLDCQNSLNVDSTYVQNRGQLQSHMPSQEGTVATDKLTVTTVPQFVQHKCSSFCNIKENEPLARGQNPLRIPMLSGWLRLIVKQRNKRVVCYMAPCGRRLRSIGEVFRYLSRTKSKLPIDLFSFDCCVHMFSQFKPKGILTYIKDITYGKEPVPVCLVNNLNKDYPPPIAYSSKRFPREGVMLNADPEFLCGCDCEDNCQNKLKCQCQQLTVKATDALGGKKNPDAGYRFRRLQEPLFTGVYECNVRCKCKATCLNRVVQNGLQVRLQVFKTEHKGWGIRCLDDLPQGIFICIYAGQLSNEEGAQVDGRECGDEYQAELDHIEVVEAMKEGYESDVQNSDDEENPEEGKEETAMMSDDEPPRPTVPHKTSSYDSDSDYDPPDWVQSEEVSKRRCNSRTSSKDSDSSNSDLHNSSKTYDPRKNAFASKELEIKPVKSKAELAFEALLGKVNQDKNQVLNKKLEAVKDESKDNIDMKVLNNGTSGDLTSRKKSTGGAIANTGNDFDVKDTKDEKEDGPKPLRSYFGEEYCYIMDAKKCGNIGRYLNHSCSPNVFVQNVFVDTHDLRFPWVAFFAYTYIRAGTELTWDYNYDVGSVPGKVLHCYCGAKDCRLRLL